MTGIYVHIPFCVQKCNYCDFLSAPAGLKQQRKYLDALKREICAGKSGPEIHSIFFGGGTPTLPPAAWTAEILETIKQHFTLEENAEITLECNPETVEEEKLRIYKQAGFNRISFGLQSTENEELKLLGRIHTYEKFLESYEAARKVGFTNCNIDLMSALPKQTKASWEKTLKKVILLSPEHISAYSLIVEEGTPFYQQFEKDELNLPSEEEERLMYERTEEILAQAGYERYEISNYARLGRESRHNLLYWSGQDYLGFGLGASSYVNGIRYHNTEVFEEYLLYAEQVDKLHQEVTVLTRGNQMEEFMFLGLRKMAGVRKSEFLQCFGVTMESVYGEVLKKWIGRELLEEKGDFIALTPLGINVSNVVLAEFLL